MPVLDLIKMASVVTGAKTHLVDRERSGVLYFGKVSVVLAADDPVNFDFLVESEKVIVQENVRHGEGEQQEARVEPRERYRAAVETGERDAGRKAEEVYGCAFRVDTEVHRCTFV